MKWIKQNDKNDNKIKDKIDDKKYGWTINKRGHQAFVVNVYSKTLCS